MSHFSFQFKRTAKRRQLEKNEAEEKMITVPAAQRQKHNFCCISAQLQIDFAS